MKAIVHYIFVELPDRFMFPEIAGMIVSVLSFFAWSASVFTAINHVLESLVLLGSLGVSIFTIRYMVKKTRKLKEPQNPG